ncbi:gluconokinase [Brachybacterium huguangmaarense]
MSRRYSVAMEDARAPFVVGLDVGSGGTRAALYDATGREVDGRKHKAVHTFTTGADGTSTIGADQVVDELQEALGIVLDGFDGPVAAIGVDTFASSLVAVDADGRALTPCITYADTRCRAQTAAIREELGEAELARLHDATGARVHSSFLAPRLRWIAEELPDVADAAERYMALGEYAAHRLLGRAAIGTAAAAWGGMLDRRSGEYEPRLLKIAGIDADALGSPLDPSDPVPVAGTPLAERFGALADAVWVPCVGDGLCANLGIGAVGPTTWGISTATSGAIRVLVEGDIPELPGGLWAYRVDATRTLVGSAMSDCGRVLDHVRATFALPEDLAEIDLDGLLGAAPQDSTPLVVPFLSGERGTGWRDGARALYAGVSASTTPEDFLRGAMEGIALSFLRIADQLRTVGRAPERIVLSGGMTGVVPPWLQILADALDAPIDHVDIARSTMRGAALLALEACEGAEPAVPPVTCRVEPVAGRAEHYRRRLARFEALADLA